MKAKLIVTPTFDIASLSCTKWISRMNQQKFLNVLY